MQAAHATPRLSTSEAQILEAFLKPEHSFLAVAKSLKLGLQELLDALAGPAIRAALNALTELDAIRRRLTLAPIVPGALNALMRLLDKGDNPTEVRRAATTILSTCTRLERAPRAPRATGYAPLQAFYSPTPSPRVAGASHQHADATAPAADAVRVPRLDWPLRASTPPTTPPASKSEIRRGGPCEESSAPLVTPGPEANVQPETEHRSALSMLAPEGRTTVARPKARRGEGAASRSDASPWIPAHNETFAPAGRANPRVTPAVLVAAAGRAISVYDLMPTPARAPPPMARAAA